MKPFLISLLFLLACSPPLWAERHALILTGSGGTEEYTMRFSEWTHRLIALMPELQFHRENVRAFSAQVKDATGPLEPITRERIRSALQEYENTLDSADDLFVFMMGHGSWINQESRFLIPGQDLTARDLAEWAQALPVRYMVVVNTTASSAGYLNALSREDRIICTATRDPSQTNATEYMEFFLVGLEDGSADRNRDEQISILEACEHAAELTAAWYETEDFIPSESALLDDNADGLGTRLPIMPVLEAEEETRLDGDLADTVWIRPFPRPPYATDQQLETYFGLLDEIETLKAEKDTLSSDTYYDRLETLLLQVARLNRVMKTGVDGAIPQEPESSP